MIPLRLQVAARALIIVEKKILLVSNDKSYWYLPGGRLALGEDLKTCLKREVMEETGLEVEPHDLWQLTEFLDLDGRIHDEPTHKVECIFRASLLNGELDPNWIDEDLSVNHSQFFSLEEVQKIKAFPNFIHEGTWLKQSPPFIYRDMT
ncbi:MAG: 8-oxo-dGTP diphosphatase [Chlamydiales bacterium]|jgi:8-oxo-dGTP diphosphatase